MPHAPTRRASPAPAGALGMLVAAALLGACGHPGASRLDEARRHPALAVGAADATTPEDSGALLGETGPGSSRAPGPAAPRTVAAPWRAHVLPPGVTLVDEHNGRVAVGEPPARVDLPWTPRLRQLREQEHLDAVVGEGDAWTRQRRLARWVHDLWAPAAPERTPPWDALDVLASIRAGGHGFCAQYAVVLVQSALSLGWHARYASLAVEGRNADHMTVEVWSDTFDRWAVLDAHFGYTVEDARAPGVPLSALDVHEALTTGRRDDLVLVDLGGDRAAHPRPRADFLAYFHHLAVDRRADHLGGPPNGWSRRESWLGWRDATTDGRPDLYADTTDDRAVFEPPRNQVLLWLLTPVPGRRAPGLVLVALRTNATALDAVEVTLDDEPPRRLPLRPTAWDVDTSADAHALRAGGAPFRTLDLETGQLLVWTWHLRPGGNRATFRAVNTEGEAGPPASVELRYEP